LLVDPVIELEAVIIPMRDLVESAASRSIVELQAIHRQAPWMTRVGRTWEDWGVTNGGAVFFAQSAGSGAPIGARLAPFGQSVGAGGSAADLCGVPRLVQDPDYLFEKLRPLIPPSITPERARRSHGRTADASLARVGRELQRAGERKRVPADSEPSMPTLLELDNIALRRELVRLRSELAEAEAARLALARSLVLRRLYNRCRRTVRMLLSGIL
jgi:hypothetical protein